jgi:hypothetical protein
MAQDKNKTNLVQKETTSREELFITALDTEGRKALYNLYVAVSVVKVNNMVAKEIGATFHGSDKALFNLGVVSGENNIIRQFKAIIERNK